MGLRKGIREECDVYFYIRATVGIMICLISNELDWGVKSGIDFTKERDKGVISN